MGFSSQDQLWDQEDSQNGELVAPVDASDLKRALVLIHDTKHAASGGPIAIGEPGFRRVASYGSDPRALWYRAAMLRLPSLSGPSGILASWIHNGQFDDVIFRVAARIPMKKMQVGVIHNEYPFNANEMVRQIREELSK